MNRYFLSIILCLLLGTIIGKSQDSISIRIKRCSRIILPFQNLINVKIEYSNTSDSISYIVYGVEMIENKVDTSQNYKDQIQGLSCGFTNRKGEFIYGFRQWSSYSYSKQESVFKKENKFRKKIDEKQCNAITYSGICKTQIKTFLFLNFASEYLHNIK